MKHFGKVESFDNDKGTGLITPEAGGKDITFERKAISWDNKTAPAVGKRLSYEVSEKDGVSSALNLQNA